MKRSTLTNVLATVLTGLAWGGMAGAQPIPNGPAGYGVSLAGCDACDAHGNAIDPGFGGQNGYRGCDGSCGGGCEACEGFGAYGMGGGWDQCGPHYFDVSADFLYWKRDLNLGSTAVTTSLGIDGPRILNTDGMGFDAESGFRITGRLDLGPATIVEATYFGSFESYDTTRVESATGQLYSIYTDFGLDPFGGIGYQDTDNANIHQFDYQSELHNGEINWRQYWVADSTTLTGTYLIGARYLRLTEDFLFYTESDVGSMHNLTSTENDLVGFQLGGDAAWCLLQGLRVVAEGKVGIYNNRSKRKVRIVGEHLGDPVDEILGDNDVAFIGEGSIGFVADILPSFSIRGGYQVLYVNGVSLAGDNFSTNDPYDGDFTSAVFSNDGDVVFNGLYAGLEYVW